MGDHGHSHGGGKNHQEEDDWKKIVSFWSIGILTAVYCVVEIAAGVYLSSLTLLSDAFHNLSDVASLYIAYWALKAARRDSGDEMTYGWARTELIGGLINGCALLSLCIYIVLEAIPRYISAASDDGSSNCSSDPSHLSVMNDKMFVFVAAGGLAVNTIGTIMFAVTGHGHTHAGGGHHGHSHGGDDDHGHPHGDKKKKKKHGHGHSHGEKKSPETQGLLDDDHHDDHGHSHAHGEKKEKKHGHGHSHGEKKKEKVSGFAIGMSVDDATELGSIRGLVNGDVEEGGHGHGHSHGEKKKEKHGHGHGHGDKDKKKKKKKGMDMNIKAVFLHYLGDMISSAFVLATGLLLWLIGSNTEKFPNATKILVYVDPTASLLIVLLILFSTVPLVKRCATILLQSTPTDVDLKDLRNRLHQVPGVHGVHDLHVWQLVDGLAISSVHIVCDHSVDFNELQHKVKKVFHKMGVHSTAVQPEFVNTAEHQKRDFCEVNCVKECEEEWCCKKPAEAEKSKTILGLYPTGF